MRKIIRLLIESIKVSFIVSFFVILINVFAGFSLRFNLYSVMFTIIASIYFLTVLVKDILAFVFKLENTKANNKTNVNKTKKKNYKNVS
ncbi:MAG: hypothetical protein R3Y64_06335 [Peptostreptococcaceae bacterium]